MIIFSYTIDLNTLVDLLLVPVCLVLAALAVGITADRLIRRYINRHFAVEENTWKYVLIRSIQGIPIFFSFIIGLYMTPFFASVMSSTRKSPRLRTDTAPCS